MKNKKREITEYLINKIIDWGIKPNKKNEYSKLQLRGFIFLIATVGTKKGEDDLLMDYTYEWSVQPYGFFDLDMMNMFKKNQYKYFKTTTSSKFIVVGEPFKSELSAEEETIINRKFVMLKNINPNLNKYDAFDLIDLMHSWYSYQKPMADIKEKGKYSVEVDSDSIKGDARLYYTKRAEFWFNMKI